MWKSVPNGIRHCTFQSERICAMHKTSDSHALLPGKTIAGKRYVHVSALHDSDPGTGEFISAAAALAGIAPERDFNVARIDDAGSKCALLRYPAFFEEAFPRLEK